VAARGQSNHAAQLDAAMKTFWDADDQGAVEKAAKLVTASGASFDEVRARLKAGRAYAKAKTGVVLPSGRPASLQTSVIARFPATFEPAKDAAE